MKTSRVLAIALIIASMFAFSACEEEVITKKDTGESQEHVPVED